MMDGKDMYKKKYGPDYKYPDLAKEVEMSKKEMKKKIIKY